MINKLKNIKTKVTMFFIFLLSFPSLAFGLDADSGMEFIFNLDPLIYTIVVGLTIAVSGLSWAIRTMWNKNLKNEDSINELHSEKLKIAMSSTETIKEAISLVQDIHSQVSKLNDGDVNKQLKDVEIHAHLINIEKDIDEILKRLISYSDNNNANKN